MSNVLEEPVVYSAREGYKRALPSLDAWVWNRLWEACERPLVLAWLRSFLPAGARLLDIGCGHSPYLPLIRERLEAYHGIDLCPEYFPTHPFRRDAGVFLHAGDVVEWGFPSARFDAVLCNRVMSHVSSFPGLLAQCARLLKPGGFLVLTDVHPAHRYTHTGIPAPEGKIFVRAHKHPLAEIAAALRSKEWHAAQSLEFDKEGLRALAPLPAPFQTRLASGEPVLHALLAQKRSRL